MRTEKNIIVLTYSPKMSSEKIDLSMQVDKVTTKSVWLEPTTDMAKLAAFIERYSPSTDFKIARVDNHTLSKMIFEKTYCASTVDNLPQVDIPHLGRLFASRKQYDTYVCPAQGVAGILRTRKMLAKQKATLATDEADQ